MLVAIKKYEFHTTKTKFYGFIIKLKKLSNITELRSFLGFCNYY